MTIQQIAEKIDSNGWAFTIYQTKPNQKRLAHHAYDLEDSAGFITNLVKTNGSEEIQIVPEKRNGSAFKQGFAKTITINFKMPEMNNNNQDTNFSALAGLQHMGLNMAEIFTAKDKATELAEVKTKNTILEGQLKTLEFDNMKLENKLEMQELKKNNDSKFMELAKSPQVLAVLTSVFSKGQTPAALGSPEAIEQNSLDPKIKYLINFLELETTPEAFKDFMIYMVKANQHENAPEISKEIIEVLVNHNIIKTQQQTEE
ncbi:hypothetical protein JJL45_09170 [Tamlana sp. s12]|uniref:hypothetical protein n=1 Tax=Tamlana sp. s12 TaxID=1630406 RepID=UPI0007FEBC92|nr:hypothetical protein [Tamlana sp. s12]OBQ52874.1 hypothetical protein VQ01_13075 [Tamlana sp. s12]QQY81100.1 hypothetical protein JJL45_09170 [Tamlana sp. s12]